MKRVRRKAAAAAVVAALMLAPLYSQVGAGLREPAWSPDGKRLAVVHLDRIWTMQADGREAKELMRGAGAQREPAWSPDGRRIAFAADRGDGFDIYLVAVTGGAPERLTFLPGDERWPAWTPDGRLIFAHRAGDQWDLMRALPTAPPAGGTVASSPEAITQTSFDETEPSVSPDGAYVLFASNRESDGGDVDLWISSLATTSPSASASASASA